MQLCDYRPSCFLTTNLESVMDAVQYFPNVLCSCLKKNIKVYYVYFKLSYSKFLLKGIEANVHGESLLISAQKG